MKICLNDERYYKSDKICVSVGLDALGKKSKREKPLKTFVEVSINLEETKNGVPYYEIKNFVKELLKYNKIFTSKHSK